MLEIHIIISGRLSSTLFSPYFLITNDELNQCVSAPCPPFFKEKMLAEIPKVSITFFQAKSVDEF